MWPAAASLVYYLGIGVQAVLAVVLGPRLGVRPVVVIAICGCYLAGMTAGARVLFELHQGNEVSAGFGQSGTGLQGMWGGPLAYLVLAVPVVWAMTRPDRATDERNMLSVEEQRRGERPGIGNQVCVKETRERCRSRAKAASVEDGRSARHGALLSPLTCRFNADSPFAAGLDLVALVAPIPLAIAKLACLCAGCCYGKPTSLPWAITFAAGLVTAPGGVPLHPTQVYDFFALLMTGALLWCVNRPRWRGMLLLWFLAAYGLGRLLTEVTRVHPPGQTSWGSLSPSGVEALAF